MSISVILFRVLVGVAVMDSLSLLYKYWGLIVIIYSKIYRRNDLLENGSQNINEIDKMAIEIKSPSIDEVVKFWQESPHSSVFTHPDVLGSLSDKVHWWMAYKGKQPQCMWPVCLPDGEQISLPDLTYYVGPLWAHNVYPMPAHRYLSRTMDVYEAFIEHFLKRYGAIQACLPKGLHDVRTFDWWNYHQPSKPRFNIRPRYTACIYDLDTKSENEIISDYRQLRRRELRSVENDGLPPRANDCSVDQLITLYESVMERQEIDVEAAKQKEITALTDLANLGYGEIVAFQDTKSNNIIAACLLLYAKGEANMVLNLVANHWRSTGLPAWMITESIKSAQSKDMNTFDFNGANSPNRGDDKHSYGAIPILYFDIKYPGAKAVG